MATKVYKHNLVQLIKFVERKKVAVPEFQRGFVWKVRQVKNLFDSLYKKYPIGSIIIWDTKQKIDARTLNGAKLPSRKYLILDGQQRMLSLYYLARPKTFSQRAVQDRFHQICDTPHTQLIDFDNFSIGKTAKGEKVLEYYRGDHNEINLKTLHKLIGESYKFPIIVISLNNYRQAIEVFERINQAGTKIATESIFLSETWTQLTDFAKILRNWKSKKAEALTKDVDTVIFIHIFALTYQLDKKAKKNQDPMGINVKILKKIAGEIREQKSDKYNSVFTECIKAMGRAMQHLKNQYRIVTVSELPSQTLLTVLSIFFYYNPKPISERQKRELNKWFWRSSLSSRYIGSGYNKNIAPDSTAMKRLALDGTKIAIPKVKISRSLFNDIDLNRGRSTIRNIVRLALWQKQPRFIDDDPVTRKDVETGQKNPEDDHFYPHDLYIKGILDSEVNNVLNLHLLNGDENVRKGKKIPSFWLEEQVERINPSPTDNAIQKYFDSELLPFKSLKQLKSFEKPFFQKKERKYVERVNQRYRSFLKKRFLLFKNLLERLQDGKAR